MFTLHSETPLAHVAPECNHHLCALQYLCVLSTVKMEYVQTALQVTTNCLCSKQTPCEYLPIFKSEVQIFVRKQLVVTGATDGIGKAYAEVLAQKGLNVVLISRTKSKLDDVAKELGEKYKVEFRTLVADFTDTEHIYHEIDKQLNGMDIGVLINNVGMSYTHPEFFLDVKDKDTFFPNLINCNIYSVTNMCKIVMPGMVERRKGVVINISSSAAQIPNPLLTVYAASKAYVVKFSEDLAAEYSKFGITVQCLLPGYVATNMSKIRSSTWMAPSPLTYVKEAIKTVGIKERTTGYYPHTLLITVVKGLDYISPKLSRWLIFRTMSNIRKRALKRATQ